MKCYTQVSNSEISKQEFLGVFIFTVLIYLYWYTIFEVGKEFLWVMSGSTHPYLPKNYQLISGFIILMTLLLYDSY
jgi:Fe2+ transport system protein B